MCIGLKKLPHTPDIFDLSWFTCLELLFGSRLFSTSNSAEIHCTSANYK